MNFVIFEKMACERIAWSPLISIEMKLKEEEYKTEYFTPPYFSIDNQDLPMIPEDQIDGVFTYARYMLEIQDYYKTKTDVYITDWGFLARDKGTHYLLKNFKFPEGSPDSRFKKLGLKINSTWNKDGHILVCMQDHDLDWYRSVIEQLKGYAGNREIRIRKPNYVDPGQKKVTEPNYSVGKPLIEDLQGAFALVTFDSTALYQGLLNCIPIFCSETCPAASHQKAIESKIISTELRKIDKAKEVTDPVLLLADVAYSQYTLEELRKGLFIENIMGLKLKKKKKNKGSE